MAQTKTRGRKSSKNTLLVIGLLLVVGVAAVGTVMMLNGGKLPFLDKTVAAKEKKAVEDNAGKIPVPLLAQTIPAYTQVSMENLWDTKSQKLKVSYLDPKKAEERGFLTKVDDVVGRVMARDKEPGYAFKESDFLPKGTRPGPTAGLEPNTRGMWVNVDKISGLRGLKRHDRFDLVAVKYAGANNRQSKDAGVDPAIAAAQAEAGMWNASNKILAQNAKIVVPFPLPGAASANKGREKEEVFIQVTESEADPVTDALAVNAQILCFSRSSRPGADGTPLPSPEPPAPVESIEVISGGKTTVHVVPTRTQAPADPDELDDGESVPETSQSSPKKDATLRDQ